MEGIGFSYFARQDPQALAVIDPAGKQWSRGELFAMVNRISRALRRSGLRRGDVIAVIAPNCAEYLAIYLAATTQVGLYVVPVNRHLCDEEVRYVLSDSGARAVFVHGGLGKLVTACRDAGSAIEVRVGIGTADGYTSIERFVAGESDAELPDRAPGRAMVYTSATTGRPKAVLLPLPQSEDALERTLRLHLSVGTQLGSGNIYMCASMLYHAAPLEGCAIALHLGHGVLLVDRPEPEKVLELIHTHQVTSAFVVPTLFVRLVRLPEELRARYRVSSLRRVMHTGAPCPPEVKRQMIAWWGPIIWETYGAAEGAGTIVSAQEWLDYPGTVGRPIAGTELKILGEAGEELPAGEVGVIYFTRYTGDTFEYKGDSEKTRACHRGRFFTAGDIGYVNEAGYLFICDRKIDMIICGGMNVYPAEVERVLMLHPHVADCAVFGVPDALLGESIHAVVQPQAGSVAGAELTAELLRFCSGRLAAAKVPRRIDYMSELPRSPTGKLSKRSLRERHWAGRAQSI